MIFFLRSDLGRRQGWRVQGGSHVSTRRSPWSHQSPSMRGLSGLNPRNIHTGAPTRYYRGIIQTYLYPSPMTADMTCDRLRYRLHDMPRSLLSLPSFSRFLSRSFSLAPSRRNSPPPFQLTLALPLCLARSRALPSPMENMQLARRVAARSRLCVLRNRNARV